MQDEVKAYLRSIKGKDYLCVENKGYLLYPDTSMVLRNILPGDICKLTTSRTEDTIAKIYVSKLENKRALKYVDNSDTVIGSSVDCSHFFDDLNVPECIYLNYNSKW